MDQATERILFPYVTTPKRIALDVIESLRGCSVVSRVALFGSIAREQYDGWSDIDVIAVVPDEDAAWHAAAALRRTMPLRWHGPFSTLPLPSGRHWPLGESPFHSIDLSFVEEHQYEAARREGIEGHSDHFEEVFVRDAVPSPGARPEVPLVGTDYGFTHGLHIAAKRMKAYLRAEGSWDDLAAAMKTLLAAARTLSHRPPGSDPDDLLNEMNTLYFTLMQKRAQYGGDPGE